MNKTELELEDIIYEADTELNKAIMALDEFIDSYAYEVRPDADKAKKFGSSAGGRENCAMDEEISWKLLIEYDRIKWLIQVAKDYCYKCNLNHPL